MKKNKIKGRLAHTEGVKTQKLSQNEQSYTYISRTYINYLLEKQKPRQDECHSMSLENRIKRTKVMYTVTHIVQVFNKGAHVYNKVKKMGKFQMIHEQELIFDLLY